MVVQSMKIKPIIEGVMAPMVSVVHPPIEADP